MKKMLFFLMLLITAQMLMALPPAGQESLFIKNYAPAQGMAGAYTSVEGDTGSFLYNPAGLARISRYNIGLFHYSGLFGTAAEALALAAPFNFGSLGLLVNYYYLGADEVFDPDGVFRFEARNYDLMVVAGLGKDIREIGRGLRTGINLKWAFQKTPENSNSILALDIGAIYEITRELFTGFSLRDLGSFPESDTAENSRPGNFNAGVSYRFLQGALLASFDLSYYFYGKTYEKIGAEYDLFRIIKIRAGYGLGYDTGNLALGLGVRYALKGASPEFRVNYAFHLNTISSALGQVHLLNLEILLPKASPSAATEERIIPAAEKAQGQGVLFTMALFKNKDKRRDLDYLKEEIPEKTLKFIREKTPGVRTVSILDRKEQPTLEGLQKEGIAYAAGGEYRMEGDLIKVRFFIVKVKSSQKVFEDTLELDIRTGRINSLYEALADRLKANIPAE